MASAGRVLPLPKGAYSSSTTYHFLDFVSYQGSTYICKQTSTGNAPTNTTYWQIMAQGTESASVAGNYYGTCSTGASTSAKIVSIPATENFVLQVGDIIGIKFDNTNTANNPSLNVNNSGAKPIYYNNSAVSTSNLWASGEANRVTIFMYDGTKWIWMGHDVDIDTDTLSDLKDTTISSASNGQVLMYDSTSNKWKNQTPTTTLAGLSDTQISSATDGQVLKYNSTSQKWVNGEDKGGILPHLIVISETGSTVTATKGTTVITATETSTGHFECDLPEFGTWTIDAILGGDDAQVGLVVDTVKVYTVDDSHFHATVTVKYPTGATCRLQSADETLYATGSPYTFTVHHAETYTITVTYNQRIYTDTVTFTTEGQSFSKTLPSPSEVDANDINMWLFFGGVSGTFSSLDEILANSTALSLLMASTDAVDYLVRCTDWASNGGLVPTMTSNTTPSGVCSASSIYSSDYPAWKAFDKNVTTNWETSAASSTNAWLQYEFPQAIIVKKFYVLSPPSSNLPQVDNYKISASNNGTDFTDLGTFTYSTISATDGETNTLNNSTAYKYYRLTVLHSPTNASIRELQFYPLSQSIPENQNAMNYIGLNNYCANTLLSDTDWRNGICASIYSGSVLNAKVPTMTSNTTPSGVVSASSVMNYEGQIFYAYLAFDKTNSKWIATTNTNQWVQYDFTRPFKVYKIYLKVSNYTSSADFRVKNFEIRVSSDNFTTYTTIFSGTMPTNTGGILDNIIPTTISIGQTVRLFVLDSYASAGISVEELQFYGREDV